MKDKRYDVIVIGGGIGGYAAAVRLAQEGMRVALVEREKLGGECLNYGCIPTKALIYFSSIIEELRRAGKYGIKVSGLSINFGRFLEWRNGIIDKLRRDLRILLIENGVELIEGESRLKSRREVEVLGKGVLESKYIVIATGSIPRTIPGFEFDGERIIDSRKALYLDEIPSTLCIVGGGAIGVEIGQSYARLGTKVTIIEIMDEILPGFSRELVRFVRRGLEESGVEINTKSRAKYAKIVGEKVKVTYEKNGRENVLEADHLLIAVGRRPNTKGLNLESIGVEIDRRGFIKVNEKRETTVPNIYAVGDVAGEPMLAHKALSDALIVARSILGEEPVIPPIPVVVYSSPELAKVGFSEEEARSQGIEVDTGMFPFKYSGRAHTLDEANGLLKMIVDKSSGEIIGVEIVGPEASELIGVGVVAVSQKMKVSDFAKAIYPHPTLSEAYSEISKWLIGEPVHLLPR